jgi:two-component system chemotaxis response regulator CheY
MNENKFVLVIDDSLPMRNFVSSVLRQDERIGGQILEAENANHALMLLAQMDGELDFIISDWNISGMPLLEFLQQINRSPNLSGAPLFLLTGEGDSCDDNVATVVGAHAILKKPFTPEQLLSLVMSSAHVVERRRAQRVAPLVCCEVDLGFGHETPNYSAAIINISESGVLLRSPVPVRGVGYVYDVASLTVFADNCAPIKLYGQVVRIEAEPRDHGQFMRIAFEFQRLDHQNKVALHNFIMLNNPTEMGWKS